MPASTAAGFAVVAEEVKRLATETAEQTTQIRETVLRTRDQMAVIESAAGSAHALAEQGAGEADAGREVLERIAALVHRSTASMTDIAALSQEQMADISVVETHVHEIADASGEIDQQARVVTQRQQELARGTERASGRIARYDTGSGLSRLRAAARTLSEQLQGVLEDAIDSRRVSLERVLALDYEEANTPDKIARFGRLFDISRANPSGFTPPKYHTAYDALVDKQMMVFMDAVTAAEPALAFALPLDLNAYACAHNTTVSQPITGDPAIDLAKNRTKRYFLDSGPLTRAARIGLGLRELELRTYTRPELKGAGGEAHARPAHGRAQRADPELPARHRRGADDPERPALRQGSALRGCQPRLRPGQALAGVLGELCSGPSAPGARRLTARRGAAPARRAAAARTRASSSPRARDPDAAGPPRAAAGPDSSGRACTGP